MLFYIYIVSIYFISADFNLNEIDIKQVTLKAKLALVGINSKIIPNFNFPLCKKYICVKINLVCLLMLYLMVRSSVSKIYSTQ